MTMHTRVVGFQPPDEEWKTKKAAWDACKTAGVLIPTELHDYFNGQPPDEHGKEINIARATTAWEADMEEGIEIEIAKLPAVVKVIRFINSW